MWRMQTKQNEAYEAKQQRHSSHSRSVSTSKYYNEEAQTVQTSVCDALHGEPSGRLP